MTLQTSGSISLSQVQSEYGGSNPISMSEYYRNGSNVPSTVTGSAGAWSSYQGNINTYYWNNYGGLRWNNVTISSSASGTLITVGSYQYQKGTFFASETGGKGSVTISYYRVRRRTAPTSQTVNTNVPTSGSISMNDFYGGIG